MIAIEGGLPDPDTSSRGRAAELHRRATPKYDAGVRVSLGITASALTNSEPGPWQKEAACRVYKGEKGDSIFYPNGETGPDNINKISRAKAFCSSCAVRAACLEYAISIREDHGIWGGLTEKERRKVLRQRKSD